MYSKSQVFRHSWTVKNDDDGGDDDDDDDADDDDGDADADGISVNILVARNSRNSAK